MNTLDFDWNQGRALLAVLEGGSLSAAARLLGSSQPTVGRHISALESDLGVVLFERVGNQLSPTPVARELGEHLEHMREAADRVLLTASGRADALTGTVSISASEGMATFLLPPVLAALRRSHPGIHLRLVVTNEASDLARREADIAVRNFRPQTPDLVTKRIRDAIARFYASPAVLEALDLRGTADLGRAEFIAFEPARTYLDGLVAMGLPVTEDQFTVVCGSHMTQLALAREGAGIAMLMEEIGEPEPGLAAVPFTPAIPVPIWLTCRRELHTSRRVRVVFDALAAGLG